MKILEKKILLASKSPRRSQLLSAAGFRFDLVSIDLDEVYPAKLPAEDVAPYLAEQKALAAAHFIQHENDILLASDCVVILDDVIYGKPSDYNDAVRILKKLSGKVHTVITGVCLLSKSKKRVFSDVSKVHLEPLTDEEIHYYIDTYRPYDKAGAYAVQEWIGLCKISKIEGTYTNIMGLPLDKVYQELHDF